MKNVVLTKIEVDFLSKALDEFIGKKSRYLGIKTKWKLENEDRFNADKAYHERDLKATIKKIEFLEKLKEKLN